MQSDTYLFCDGSKAEKNKKHNRRSYAHRSKSNPQSSRSKDISYDSKTMRTSYTNEHYHQRHINHHDQDKHVNKLQVETNQREPSNYGNRTNNSISHQEEVYSQKDVGVKVKKSLTSYVEDFLQQRSDFSWLTEQFDPSTGSDHFKNLIVHSTFPVSLNQTDFEYYIDMTFNDFPQELTTRMKCLFQRNNENPVSEDILIDDHSDGALSTTLIQILSHKNDRNELEILVGYVTTTQRLSRGYTFTQTYWEQHRKQIKRALQYLYGKEALKELSLE